MRLKPVCSGGFVCSVKGIFPRRSAEEGRDETNTQTAIRRERGEVMCLL